MKPNIVGTPKGIGTEALRMGDFNQRFLNIGGIMDISDKAERSFFNWLNTNEIWWSISGSNLRNIVVYEKDIQTIKNTWNEVNEVNDN